MKTLNPYPAVCKFCKAVIYTPYELHICPKCRKKQDTGEYIPHVRPKKNTIPRKGIGTRKFGNQTYYYAGRTIWRSKAGSIATQLTMEGVKTRVTESRDMGSLIWTDRPVRLDLAETRYNPGLKCPSGHDAIIIKRKFKEDFPEEAFSICPICNLVYDISGKPIAKMLKTSPYFETLKLNPLTKVHPLATEAKNNPDIFIRKVKKSEKHGSHYAAFLKIPDKVGYRKGYKPYGEKGAGYYYIKEPNPMTKVHSLAIEAKKKWKEDVKAGHGAGEEYWAGYAGAAYLMSNPKNNPTTYQIQKWNKMRKIFGEKSPTKKHRIEAFKHGMVI